MNSLNVDAARNNQVHGVAGPTEAGSLFPRVHASEIEKAGRRAPPRNKMALFEQFTVPSHRFMPSQPNRTSIGHSNQSQKLVDYEHPYLLYCPPAPYSNAVPLRPRSLHVTSSCVTSIASGQEMEKAFGSQRSKKSSFSGMTTKSGSLSSNLLSDEKANGISDEFSKPSLPTAPIKIQDLLCTSSVFEKICDKYASASFESAQLPVTTAQKNDMLQVKSIERVGVEFPVAENGGHYRSKAGLNTVMEINALKTNRPTVKVDAVVENFHGCSSFTVEQACRQPDIDGRKVWCKEIGQRNEFPEIASSTDLDIRDSRINTSSPSLDCLADTVRRSANGQVLHACQVYEDTQNFCPSDGQKQDVNQSAEVVAKATSENTPDSQNNQIGSNEVLELSQQCRGRSTDDSFSSVLAVRAIKPRDVIHAVGQQQFWKARTALIRQQHVFSDQVFELHKLIKVQRLLAEIPCTLYDEEVTFDMVDHCGEPPPCNSANVEKSHNENTPMTTLSRQLSLEDDGNKAGNEPESKQNSQWYVKAGNDGSGSMSYLPVLTDGGISAWGYPNLGMGQWTSALPVQGRPYVYQSYVSAFPQPFGGLYGLPGLGSPSPTLPICIPYAAQRGEPWEELSLNLGPLMPAAGSDLLSASVGLMAQGLPSAYQYVHPSYNPTFYAGASVKKASNRSGASISSQREVKSLQASGAESHPHSRRSIQHCVANLISQNEYCPGSSTKLKSTSAVCMQSMSGSKRAGSYHERTGDLAQKNISSMYQTLGQSKQDVSDEVRREDVHCRGSKCRQSDQVSFTNGISEDKSVHPPDQCGNALNLFPVVPSLGRRGGQSISKQMDEEWRGRVIKAVPHPAVAASQSAAGILLSLQRERWQ